MMKRFMFFLLAILVINSLLRHQASAQEDDEEDEDDAIAAPKHTTTTRPANNAKSVATTKSANSKSASPASTTNSKFAIQTTLTQKSPSTTADPFATATYSPVQNDEDSTVCKPVCLPYKCDVDTSLFTANGTRKVLPALGKLKFICNKYYLFSKIEATWTRAQEICCTLNMRLLNIESYAQFKCLKSLTYESGVHQKIGITNYWIGASDENCEGTFGWCDTDTPLAKWIPWAAAQPDNHAGGENCICLTYNFGLMNKDGGTALLDSSCEVKAQFICEDFVTQSTTTITPEKKVKKNLFYNKPIKRGECKEPKCPPFTCKIEPKFVGLNGMIKVPSKVGKIVKICNRKYLFGQIKVNWTEAQELCCALNMRLVNFKTEEQFKCLKSVGTNYGQVHVTLGFNWYWVGATDIGCEGRFGWCNIRQPVQDWKEWPNGKPDGGTGENCMIIWYEMSITNKYPNTVNIDDNSCGSKLHFICEESNKNNSEIIATIVANKIAHEIEQKKSQALQIKYHGRLKRKNTKDFNGWNVSDSSKAKSGCLYPRCPHYNCVVNMRFLEPTEVFTVPAETGVLKTVCGKQFMFSREEKTWTEAQEVCCSLDMRLYNVESAEQMTCIRDLNIESGLHYHMGVVSYWTGGSDQGCEAKFGWCNSRQMLDKWIAWAKGAPKNANGNENCLALDYVVHFSKSEQASNFTDANCELKKKFICESL